MRPCPVSLKNVIVTGLGQRSREWTSLHPFHISRRRCLSASCQSMDEKSSPENQSGQPQQKASVNDTSSIPNGGFKAWLQVVGTFFIFFNTWYGCLRGWWNLLTRSTGVS